VKELQIVKGNSKEIKSLGGKPVIPKNPQFEIIKYRNPSTNRKKRVFICTDGSCEKTFNKWH